MNFLFKNTNTYYVIFDHVYQEQMLLSRTAN